MDVSYPKVVQSLNGVHVKSVACGEYQTCVLTHSGQLYTWGDNKYDVHSGDGNRIPSQWLPCRLSGLLDCISISNVACGEWHTAIVSSSGQLFTYGDGTFGVLGHGNLRSVSHPKEVESLKGLRVKSVACGSWHTAAIVDIIFDQFKFNVIGKKLFTWGDGDKGRLGHNDFEKKLLPTCVAQLVDHDLVQVSCGRMLTVALTNTGKVFTMGSSVHGQLGNPQAKDKSVTIVEGNLKHEFVKEISAGSYHVAALTSTGNVYTWGMGMNGQLGLGNIEDRNMPTFVEALRDRRVEKIACGLNLTAAICLHKSISVRDQSACSGCRMPFGFTRKKHNCYNCGLLFCSTCSSKKFTNASLAPNKSKPSRVCDSCFDNLRKITHSNRMLSEGSRKPSSLHKTFYSEKEEKGELSPRGDNLLSMGESYNVESQRKKQYHVETVSSFLSGLPQWGQVPCPVTFESYYDKNSAQTLLKPKSTIYSAENLLAEEVQRLRAEARSLETQYQFGNRKIQECHEAMEKAWSIAREEAAKRKAANEIIKALALRLHAMSEKVSPGKDAKDGVDPSVSPITPTCTDSIAVVGGCPAFAATHLLAEVKLPQDRQVDSLSSSPIVFSNTLKSTGGRELCYSNSRSVDNSDTPTTHSIQNGTKVSRLEWVEQYEPGVYITFTILPGGQKGLKRVRFSRKRFAEKEAERWWEENQVKVYQKYGVEGYNNSNQNQRNR